jgi:ketosteroid isomerase-like protein
MIRKSVVDMRRALLALGLFVPLITQAIASDKTDVLAPVHQFIDGFNKADFESAIAACTDDAFVIDDFPPHEWKGSGCRKWANDFEALAERERITDARIILGRPRHVDVTDDSAYVVVPVTLSYKLKGKPKKLPGLFTASLHKLGDSWRIAGWAWADL